MWLLSGGRALETLVKQHAEMSLFVKHVADKHYISLFFPDATVDIAIPSLCTASSHAVSVKAFRWRTRSDHVTRKARIMRPTDKVTADSRSVQSFAIIKNTGHKILVIGRFHTRVRNGSSV